MTDNTPPNDNVHRLTYQDKKIVLVGTAHVSKESADLVTFVIDTEKPDTVCVELCPSRFQTIRQKNRWQEMDIIKVVKEKKAFLLLSNLLLASFQKRIAQKMDIRPGEEMIRAIDAAEQNGAGLELADRDIRVTLSRVWRTMSFWNKVKILFQLILSAGEVDEIDEAEIERMKKQDVLEALLSEVGKSLPALKTILIDERDTYLREKIKNAPGERIVAVVGAGHVPGIIRHWEQDNDLTELETIPPKKKSTKVIKWLLPTLIIGLFAAGFYFGDADKGKDMLKWWILANGILAGLGALIAFGHPLTILSSVMAAPLTSLNPMIAAGWVSGLVEAFSRKPKVIDFESLQDDIGSVRGFWRNKVTRILLVTVFTNLGSTIGTFVALPMMARILA